MIAPNFGIAIHTDKRMLEVARDREPYGRRGVHGRQPLPERAA